MKRCTICYVITSDVWVWQPFGPDGSTLNFSFPGSHYRGFPALPVCDACKTYVQMHPKQQQTFIYKGVRFVLENETITPMGEVNEPERVKRV